MSVNTKPLKVLLFKNENIYLCYSSLTFILPGFYGISKKEYYVAPLILLGTPISINFWRNPKYDWKRMLDIWYVKLTIPLFIINSNKIKNKYIFASVPITLMMAAYLFEKSCKEYYINNPQWICYHLAFHGCCFLSHTINIMANVHKM